MQLLDRATGRVIAADDTNDLSDLVGIAQYVATALDEHTIELADAEGALEEWAERAEMLLLAAELTSHPSAASLLESCARRADPASRAAAAS